MLSKPEMLELFEKILHACLKMGVRREHLSEAFADVLRAGPAVERPMTPAQIVSVVHILLDDEGVVNLADVSAVADMLCSRWSAGAGEIDITNTNQDVTADEESFEFGEFTGEWDETPSLPPLEPADEIDLNDDGSFKEPPDGETKID